MTAAWLGLAAAGAGAGLLGAVLGIGGGVFLIPVLVLVFGIPMTTAVATGLVAVIATSSAVGSVNVRLGTANFRLGMILELTTVTGALLGAFVAGVLSPRFMIGLFGVFLVIVTALLWRKRRGGEADPEGGDGEGPEYRYYDPAVGRTIGYRVQRLPAGMVVSLAAGSLSGLLGIGGGVIKVPALHLFCGIPMKAAAATSNFMIGVTAAASAFLYFGRGQVDPMITAPVVVGVLCGSVGGVFLNRKLTDMAVRRTFALMTLFLAIQMLRRAAHG